VAHDIISREDAVRMHAETAMDVVNDQLNHENSADVSMSVSEMCTQWL
jgi:hypothetical protein